MAILAEDPRDFTLAQRTRIIDTLNERFGDVECEICGNENWGLNPRPVSPLFLVAGSSPEAMTVDLSTSHPSIMIHCSVCGNSKILSLAVLKVDLGPKPSDYAEKTDHVEAENKE